MVYRRDPDGLLVVPPDRELAFLHPLPVRRLWGVGAITAEKLGALMYGDDEDFLEDLEDEEAPAPKPAKKKAKKK